MLSVGRLLQGVRFWPATQALEKELRPAVVPHVTETKMRTQRLAIESIDSRRRFHRKAQGVAAALLPFKSNGRIAVEAFQRHLVATHSAGLMNAVNMDTGYENYLSENKKGTGLNM